MEIDEIIEMERRIWERLEKMLEGKGMGYAEKMAVLENMKEIARAAGK